jgi:hypothetical protein
VRSSNIPNYRERMILQALRHKMPLPPGNQTIVNGEPRYRITRAGASARTEGETKMMPSNGARWS